MWEFRLLAPLARHGARSSAWRKDMTGVAVIVLDEFFTFLRSSGVTSELWGQVFTLHLHRRRRRHRDLHARRPQGEESCGAARTGPHLQHHAGHQLVSRGRGERGGIPQPEVLQVQVASGSASDPTPDRGANTWTGLSATSRRRSASTARRRAPAYRRRDSPPARTAEGLGASGQRHPQDLYLSRISRDSLLMCSI